MVTEHVWHVSEILAVVVTVPTSSRYPGRNNSVDKFGRVAIAGKCLLYGEECKETAVLSSDKVRFSKTIRLVSVNRRMASG